MSRPKLFVGVKATGNARFFIESLTANTEDVPNARNQYEGRTPELPIPDDLVAPTVDIRAAVRVLSGTARVSLYAWSSALQDDPTTPDEDEKWQTIAEATVSDTSKLLKGKFHPLEVNT